MSANSSSARYLSVLYTYLMSKVGHVTTVVTVNDANNAPVSDASKFGTVTVTRVLRCVISVVGVFGGFVALPLAVRDLIKMVIEGVAWVHAVLPL